uniref:Uncharacterized protein n=1 Tax=Anguilla anguilla TaxID=7936 RepID=A0A0E9U0U4_ANGAN
MRLFKTAGFVIVFCCRHDRYFNTCIISSCFSVM